MVADDRGQLLLLGGLAIALVFLLTIPLANTLVMSDSAASSGSSVDIARVDDREAAVEADLTTLVERTRAANDSEQFADALNRSLANYSQMRTQVSGPQDGAYVETALNLSASDGNVTTQTSTDFESPTGRSEWDLSQNTDHIDQLSFTIRQVTGAGLDLKFDNATGASVRIVISSVGGNTVEVSRNDSFSSSATDVCSQDLSTGSIELNLTNGTCDPSGSPPENFDSYEVIEPPYQQVTLKGGTNFQGDYRYAATGTFPSKSYGGSQTPYPITTGLDLIYDGPVTSYERTLIVEQQT